MLLGFSRWSVRAQLMLLVAAEPIRVLRVASRSGLGLLNMRETAEFVGGRLSIESVSGGGTQVWVEIDPSFEEEPS